MRFTVEYIRTCTANNHIRLRLTFPDNGNQTRDIIVNKRAIMNPGPLGVDGVRDAIEARLAAFVLEEEWNTLPELRTALEAKEFDIR